MYIRLKKPEEPLKLALAASVFILFMYYMLWQVNFYLAQSLRESYYTVAVPVLVAGTLYFRRLKDGPEYALLLAYWLWVILSRFLNGDLAMSTEHRLILELSLMLPFFVTGLALDKRTRRRFLDWLSAFVGGYYFLLGLVCFAAFILRRQFVNPITEGLIGIDTPAAFTRINILDTNPCSTAFWFMSAFFLMVYQFFSCKNKLWRIPIVIAALVHYSVVAMTYTRSVKLSMALCMGLLAMQLVFSLAKLKRKSALGLLMAAAFLIGAPLCYKGFDFVTEGLGRISQAVLVEEAGGSDSQEQTVQPVIDESAYVDYREWEGDINSFSSGRITVYKSALYAIGRDPSVLWRGKLLGESMNLANQMLAPREQPHFHNYLIQVLMLTGIPGLLLILALSLMIVVKTVKFFFSREEGATLGAKMLTLPVTAGFLYSMLEASIFTNNDERSLFFYLACGLLLGFYYDVYPRKAAGPAAERQGCQSEIL